jgi:hypothetical protein
MLAVFAAFFFCFETRPLLVKIAVDELPVMMTDPPQISKVCDFG